MVPKNTPRCYRKAQVMLYTRQSFRELAWKSGTKNRMINVAINVVKWNFFLPSIVRNKQDSWVQPRGCQWVIHFAPWDHIQAFSSLASILSLSLSFSLVLRLSSSLVQQLWSRVRVKGISRTPAHAHTQEDVLLLGLNAAEGVESQGCIFPCQYLTAGCIWNCGETSTALWIPPLAPGPWPRGCVLSPAGTLNGLCVCVCVCVWVCVFAVCVNGQSQEGFCHSVFSHSATSLNIAGCQPPRPGQVICLLKHKPRSPPPPQKRISLWIHFPQVSNSFFWSCYLGKYIFLPVFLPPPALKAHKITACLALSLPSSVLADIHPVPGFV